MHSLDHVLNSPAVNRESKILNLFDTQQFNLKWLSNHAASVTHCMSEDDLQRVIDSGMEWDLVIATHGIQRFYATASNARLETFVSWLRSNSRLSLVTPRHFAQDPSNLLLGPHRPDRPFFAFQYFSEVNVDEENHERVPVIAFSDYALFDGFRWWSESELLTLTNRAQEEPSSGEELRRPRTFLTTDGLVIKIQAGCPEFFDSMETLREAETLQRLRRSSEPQIKFPKLKRMCVGNSVTTTVRESINGTTHRPSQVSELSRGTSEVLHAVVDLAISYAEQGLFHNDFRPWNIIDTPVGLQLIDFADVSYRDEDVRDLPQIVALIGSLIAIGNLDTNGMPLRERENFDIDLLSILRKPLGDLGLEMGSLYTQPWLNLSSLKGLKSLSTSMSVKQLCLQLLPNYRDFYKP